MWRHNYVIDRNEYLIFYIVRIYQSLGISLQFLFISANNSWRYERKCEWVFFSEHSVVHRKIVRTDDIVSFQDFVTTQVDAPKMHRSTRQIARQSAIHLITLRCTAYRIVQIKNCVWNVSRNVARRSWLQSWRVNKLLRLYPQSAVDLSQFFSDEKVFTWVAPPVNYPQNDRVYVPQSPQTSNNRQFRTHPTFPSAISGARSHGADFFRRGQWRLLSGWAAGETHAPCSNRQIDRHHYLFVGQWVTYRHGSITIVI